VNALAAVRVVAQRLEAAGVPSPRVDAEHLVAHILGVSRSGVYASDREPTEDEERELEALVERRRQREPLAYILGEWGFRHLTLAVDPRALVPRSETEGLVERCLERLKDTPEPHVLDVGVGSGAIALAIAEEHAGARVVAVDRSADALALAADNLARSSVNGRIELRQGDLLAGLAGPFDLVVSNPPYVSPAEYETLEPEIRLYEPREAIVGVGVGAEIASEARPLLASGGWLLLECGDGQAPELADELAALGYKDVVRTRDLAGRDRIVEGKWG
jgi:release factor glutamine methyltransferase